MAAVTSCENTLYYKLANWGHVYSNPDSFETADFFYANRPSLYTKPVNLLIETASLWNRSPAIYWCKKETEIACKRGWTAIEETSYIDAGKLKASSA